MVRGNSKAESDDMKKIIFLSILIFTFISTSVFSKNDLYEKIDLFGEVLENIKKSIEKILDNNKAQSIASINLKNKSYIADYMVVASGTSSRHLQSLSEILVSELKKLGMDDCRIEGKDSTDWKLVDAHDVIVHLFHPEKREFYDLEKMWSEEIPKQKAMI